MDAWARYEAWDRALAARLFTEDSLGLPVYLEVTPAVLADIAVKLGICGDPTEDLAQAVRATLQLEGRHGFDVHRRRLQRWRREQLSAAGSVTKRSANELSAPPVIALLVVLVIAAERMGQDASQAAHAYYPRLNALLGLTPAEASRLKQAFPETEVLWAGLTQYLVAEEGRVGLPTAEALSFRYVGIPQSQALVRAADRAKLPVFFTRFGLAAGSEVIAADLERLLDAWISGTPCPVSSSLRHLWGRGPARERVAGVVAVELRLWDGAFRDSSDQSVGAAGQVSICADLRRSFGGRSIELSFIARLPRQTETDQLVVMSAAGHPAVGVIPTIGGRLRPIPGSRFDSESLVGALLELQEPVLGQSVARRPRRVVPLRRDELLGTLVETQRLQLADETTILVKDEDRLLRDVLEIIDRWGSRGGLFRRDGSDGAEKLAGLPDGWVLIEKVSLFAVPQDVRHVDLHALIPLTTAQLNFAGGLKMPGRVRKFSSLQPPEIRAVVAEAKRITVTIASLGDEPGELHRWTEDANAIVISLDELGLADGDYEVTLQVGDEVLSRPTLRLRSADTPDAVTWETCTPLNYELDAGAAAAVSAVVCQGDSRLYVDGVNTVGERHQSLAERPAAERISWSATKVGPRVVQPVVVLGTADEGSCMMTGKHYLDYPTWHGGKATSSTIKGVCRGCGVVKTAPTRPRWKGLDAPPEAPIELRLKRHSAVSDPGPGWNVCLDTVVHLGGGTTGTLDRIASHVDGTSLFADEFVRTLDLAGHIDVRRDQAMAPQEWEANPAYLAETIKNGFVLAGAWSVSMRARLAEHAAARGGRLVREVDGGAQTSGMPIWFLRGLSAGQLDAIAEEMGLTDAVVPDAARRMLAVLPPLSQVEDAMPIVPIPQHTKATIFSLQDAAWKVVPGVGIAGAYRVEQSFRRLTIWVDPRGAVDRTARIGTVQLVKHLAARAARRPLLAYLPTNKALIVPRGADLPGLYGRVAALCSGRLPVASARTRSLAYLDVPRDIADGLNSLLAG